MGFRIIAVTLLCLFPIARARGVEKNQKARGDEARFLQEKVSFDFHKVPLQKALSLLAKDASFQVRWFERPQDEPEDAEVYPGFDHPVFQTPITLKVKDMRVELVVKWMLRLSGLEYTIKGKVFYISTKRALRKHFVTEEYRFPPHAFSAGLRPLTELLRGRIFRSREWESAGATFSWREGRLTVTHLPRFHVRVTELISMLTTETTEPWPPLHRALRLGDTDNAKRLLDESADAKDKWASGLTPLHLAVIYGRMDALKILIDARADLNAKDHMVRSLHSSGTRTPLQWALLNGQTRAALALMSAGADMNAKDSDERPSLYFAVKEENVEAVRALIKGGADVQAQFWRAPGGITFDGLGSPRWTCLYEAVQSGNVEIVRLLLAAGAKTTAPKCPYGVIRVAKHHKHSEVVKILDAWKAKAND